MVTCKTRHSERLIVLQPNSSASWAINKRVLVGMTIFSLVIAAAFAAAGAWVVLPFAGLEMLALGSALYWVSWKQHYRHVLHFRDGRVLIEKGVYYPRRRWHWPCSASRILVTEATHPLDPLHISLCCEGETVRIGDFLGREDSCELLRFLKEQGLRVGQYGPASALKA